MQPLTEETRYRQKAAEAGLEFVDPTTAEIDPAVVWRMPRKFAEEHRCIPIRKLPRGQVQVVFVEPPSGRVVQDLDFLIKAPVLPALTTPTLLQRAIYRHYDMGPAARHMLRGVPQKMRDQYTTSPTSLALDSKAIQNHLRRGSEAPYVDLFNFLLINSIERGSSDLHIEPQEDSVRVRMRIDGLLREALILPQWSMGPLIGRIKVIAKMNVANRRTPQDGRATARLGERRVDLRISTLPGQHGEKVVIRILDPTMILTDLGGMGWDTGALQTWYRLLARPQGLVFVVGPTGSGKSTTLYGSIHRVNTENISIVTIEDPVEYSLAGITQVQVNVDAGITFASSIRAMLRQDPNVLVIGETRDEETAEAVVHSANTGHLVLSTLHTTSAVSTITRLLDLKIPPYQLGPALNGIVAQRLVRRLCPDCARLEAPQSEDWERLGIAPRDLGPDVRQVGQGCPTCQYTGYVGRTGVYEILQISDAMRERIEERAPEHALWDQARAEGITTLLGAALAKVSQGLTTLREVARVIPINSWEREEAKPPVLRVAREPKSAPPVAWETATPQAATATAEPEPMVLDLADLEVLPEIEPEVYTEPGAPVEISPLETMDAGLPTVLIVDDSEEIRDVLELTLEDDYQIQLARDGVEAMESVADAPPDLIVLDVMMPRMTGHEVCERLKSDPATEHIPVLMLSARGETAHIKEGFYAGADDYLPKPFDPEELMLRLRSLLRRARR